MGLYYSYYKKVKIIPVFYYVIKHYAI
jgi:hypothetical protein